LLDNPLMNWKILIMLNNILGKLKPYSLIVSTVKEGKGILFNALAKFTDSYPPSDIRWMLENMYREPYSYPPSDFRYKLENLYLDPTTFPIQVWGIADWDCVLQIMIAEDPHIEYDVSPEDWPSIRNCQKEAFKSKEKIHLSFKYFNVSIGPKTLKFIRVRKRVRMKLNSRLRRKLIDYRRERSRRLHQKCDIISFYSFFNDR